MGDRSREVSRRELLKGASAAAFGGQGVLKQQTGRVQKRIGWPDHKQSAIKGVRQALELWKIQARFADVRIMAVSAIGGKLVGPDLTPMIQSAMLATGTPANISGAFARAVGAAWKQWADSVTVPGLPWYPAFAAFPGPMAPPMPNVPMPVATLLSPGDSAMQPTAIAASLRKELGAAASEAGAERETTDFAYWLSANFAFWKVSAQVMTVLGKGPIPTFAPPYVPVGPVVGGDIISSPGHLAAAAGFSLPALAYFDTKTAFESTVANAFKVRLENGAAGLEGANAHLFGDVSIAPAGNSLIKVLVRGAEMTLSQTSRGSRNLLQKARIDLGTIQQKATSDQRITESERVKIAEQQKLLEAMSSEMSGLKGSGRLEVQVGQFSLNIPSAQFEMEPNGRLSILGGTVDIKGVSHTVGKGSFISPTEARLVGWIPLGNYAITDSALTLRPSGITGGGKLQAFAHSFNLNYDLTGARLRASAEAGGPDRGWQSMPFVDGAQYQATGARIIVSIDGPSVAATVRIPSLGVRTAATKPDGKPWVERSSSPGTLSVAANGDVLVSPPGLPNPGDPFRAARDSCEASARAANQIPDVSNLLVGEAKRLAQEARDKAISALNNALNECRTKNPTPPPMPSVPQRFTVKVGNLVG